jgi:hypothetical protein
VTLSFTGTPSHNDSFATNLRTAPTGLTEMPMNPNLSRRPAKPALGNGRVQRGALRALWVLGIASTSEIAEWTHARARAYGELSDNHTRAARRAAERYADKVRRVPPYGAWLWRLKDTEC